MELLFNYLTNTNDQKSLRKCSPHCSWKHRL